MGDVIQLRSRSKKVSSEVELAYKAKILSFDRLELLTEMVRFQQERTLVGHLTPELMVTGQILFKALEEQAETQEMQRLAKSYRRHLEFEYQNYLKG